MELLPMTLPDWRKPCEHGLLGQHSDRIPCPGFDLNFEGEGLSCGVHHFRDCSGGSPITYADLEALGEKVWWCGFHDCQGFDAGIGHPYLGYCWEGYYFHDPAIGTLDCRMVERRLLIPLPDSAVKP